MEIQTLSSVSALSTVLASGAKSSEKSSLVSRLPEGTPEEVVQAFEAAVEGVDEGQAAFFSIIVMTPVEGEDPADRPWASLADGYRDSVVNNMGKSQDEKETAIEMVYRFLNALPLEFKNREEESNPAVEAFWSEIREAGIPGYALFQHVNWEKIEKLIEEKRAELEAAYGVNSEPPLSPEALAEAMKAIEEALADFRKELMRQLEEKGEGGLLKGSTDLSDTSLGALLAQLS